MTCNFNSSERAPQTIYQISSWLPKCLSAARALSQAESQLLAAHAASCLDLLQVAVPSLEVLGLNTTMHWDELHHPQEEGQRELGQVRLLPLNKNCLSAAVSATVGVAAFLHPSAQVCGRCLPAHARRVPRAISLSPTKKHGKSLSLLESVREGTRRIAAKSETM